MRALPAAAAPARGAAPATGAKPATTVLGYEPLASAGASRDAEDAVDAAAAAADALPRLVVAWRYAQRGKQRGGGDLVSVNAESSFALAHEPTATVAGGGAAGGGAAGGASRVVSCPTGHRGDSSRRMCDRWCAPKDARVHCSWCRCADCAFCAS